MLKIFKMSLFALLLYLRQIFLTETFCVICLQSVSRRENKDIYIIFFQASILNQACISFHEKSLEIKFLFKAIKNLFYYCSHLTFLFFTPSQSYVRLKNIFYFKKLSISYYIKPKIGLKTW